MVDPLNFVQTALEGEKTRKTIQEGSKELVKAIVNANVKPDIASAIAATGAGIVAGGATTHALTKVAPSLISRVGNILGFTKRFQDGYDAGKLIGFVDGQKFLVDNFQKANLIEASGVIWQLIEANPTTRFTKNVITTLAIGYVAKESSNYVYKSFVQLFSSLSARQVIYELFKDTLNDRFKTGKISKSTYYNYLKRLDSKFYLTYLEIAELLEELNNL